MPAKEMSKVGQFEFIQENSAIIIQERENIVNVSSVAQLSPFRYPGGKTWLVPDVLRWISSRRSGHCQLFVEPFVGGGIVSLTLAERSLADKCIMVELDDEIAAVWQTIVSGDIDWLAERIVTFKLNNESAQEVISSAPTSPEELAFRTILKNRTFHGGILAPGSGLLKHGENGKGIHSRWYPETLAKRLQRIKTFRQRLVFIKGDAFEVIGSHLEDNNATYFVDPPYTASSKKAGSRLYRHHAIDHAGLFGVMSKSKGAFMMTYDDADEVRTLCSQYGLDYVKVPMKGTHHIKYYELLICDDTRWDSIRSARQ